MTNTLETVFQTATSRMKQSQEKLAADVNQVDDDTDLNKNLIDQLRSDLTEVQRAILNLPTYTPSLPTVFAIVRDNEVQTSWPGSHATPLDASIKVADANLVWTMRKELNDLITSFDMLDGTADADWRTNLNDMLGWISTNTANLEALGTANATQNGFMSSTQAIKLAGLPEPENAMSRNGSSTWLGNSTTSLLTVSPTQSATTSSWNVGIAFQNSESGSSNPGLLRAFGNADAISYLQLTTKPTDNGLRVYPDRLLWNSDEVYHEGNLPIQPNSYTANEGDLLESGTQTLGQTYHTGDPAYKWETVNKAIHPGGLGQSRRACFVIGFNASTVDDATNNVSFDPSGVRGILRGIDSSGGSSDRDIVEVELDVLSFGPCQDLDQYYAKSSILTNRPDLVTGHSVKLSDGRFVSLLEFTPDGEKYNWTFNGDIIQGGPGGDIVGTGISSVSIDTYLGDFGKIRATQEQVRSFLDRKNGSISFGSGGDFATLYAAWNYVTLLDYYEGGVTMGPTGAITCDDIITISNRNLSWITVSGGINTTNCISIGALSARIVDLGYNNNTHAEYPLFYTSNGGTGPNLTGFFKFTESTSASIYRSLAGVDGPGSTQKLAVVRLAGGGPGKRDKGVISNNGAAIRLEDVDFDNLYFGYQAEKLGTIILSDGCSITDCWRGGILINSGIVNSRQTTYRDNNEDLIIIRRSDYYGSSDVFNKTEAGISIMVNGSSLKLASTVLTIASTLTPSSPLIEADDGSDINLEVVNLYTESSTTLAPVLVELREKSKLHCKQVNLKGFESAITAYDGSSIVFELAIPAIPNSGGLNGRFFTLYSGSEAYCNSFTSIDRVEGIGAITQGSRVFESNLENGLGIGFGSGIYVTGNRDTWSVHGIVYSPSSIA